MLLNLLNNIQGKSGFTRFLLSLQSLYFKIGVAKYICMLHVWSFNRNLFLIALRLLWCKHMFLKCACIFLGMVLSGMHFTLTFQVVQLLYVDLLYWLEMVENLKKKIQMNQLELLTVHVPTSYNRRTLHSSDDWSPNNREFWIRCSCCLWCCSWLTKVNSLLNCCTFCSWDFKRFVILSTSYFYWMLVPLFSFTNLEIAFTKHL